MSKQTAVFNEPEPFARSLHRTDLGWLEKFFRPLSAPLADVNPLVVLAWRKSANIKYVVEDNVLYLFGDTDFGRVLWIPPLRIGELSKSHILRGLDLLRVNQNNRDREMILNLCEDYPMWACLRSDPAFSIKAISKEYQYDAQAVASLTGHDLKTKRADARFFQNEYNPQITSFEPGFVPECLKLLDEWLIQKKVRSSVLALQKAKREYLVCKSALEDGFPLNGVVCMIDSRVVAFSLGVPHEIGVFNCVFEKTDLDLRGCSAFVFSSLAKSFLGRFQRINAGEDWGIDELALAKRLWRPVVERPIFRLIRR